MRVKNKIPYHKPFPLPEYERALITLRIDECLQNGQLSLKEGGYYVNRLEQRVKDIYPHVKHVVFVSSATQGLRYCYQFYPSELIHLPSFTWESVLMEIKLMGKRFELYDINKHTWLMEDPKVAYGIISPNLTFGNVLDWGCNNITVIDGAHNLGCRLENIGSATVLSLAPTKLITSCEGGFVLTNDDHLATYCRTMRKYLNRVSEVHAIIGLQYLNHVLEIMLEKKKIFDYYENHIPGVFQEVPLESNYNTIGFLNIEDLIIPKHIETRQYYEPIVRNSFLNAEYVYHKIVCLPSWFGVDYKQIVEDIKEVNGI